MTVAYFYFRSNIPEAVVYEQKDVEAFYDKTGIEEGAYDFSLSDLMKGNVVRSGELDVDAVFTSEEITGGLQSVDGSLAFGGKDKLLGDLELIIVRNLLLMPVVQAESTVVESYEGQGMFTNLNVRFTGDNRMEVFANVSEGITGIYEYLPQLETLDFVISAAVDAVISAEFDVVYSEASGFSVEVVNLQVNGAPLPKGTIDEYKGDIVNKINNTVRDTEGFSIQTFKITADGLQFTGTIPEELKSIGK